MFEAYPSIQRRTYEPTMASPPSFGLGGSTNHSLRDVGLTEPSQEVDRPIASQGNMRSIGGHFMHFRFRQNLTPLKRKKKVTIKHSS